MIPPKTIRRKFHCICSTHALYQFSAVKCKHTDNYYIARSSRSSTVFDADDCSRGAESGIKVIARSVTTWQPRKNLSTDIKRLDCFAPLAMTTGLANSEL